MSTPNHPATPDPDYPVFRSDANTPTTDPDPWPEHLRELHDHHDELEHAESAPLPTRRDMEAALNQAGKDAIENAKGLPPEVGGTLDNPAASITPLR